MQKIGPTDLQILITYWINWRRKKKENLQNFTLQMGIISDKKCSQIQNFYFYFVNFVWGGEGWWVEFGKIIKSDKIH